MLIKILDTHTEISEKVGDTTRTKVVSLDGVLQVLGKYNTTNNGLLPDNLRFLESKDEAIVACLQIPKMKRRITHQSRTDERVYEGVACPAGVLILRVIKHGTAFRITNSWIYAIRGDRVLSDRDTLYKMPFPNVYDHNNICWGSVRLDDLPTLSSLEGMIGKFWSAHFNNDLFTTRNLSDQFQFDEKDGSVRGMLAALQQIDRFDDSLLVSARREIKATVMAALKE